LIFEIIIVNFSIIVTFIKPNYSFVKFDYWLILVVKILDFIKPFISIIIIIDTFTSKAIRIYFQNKLTITSIITKEGLVRTIIREFVRLTMEMKLLKVSHII